MIFYPSWRSVTTSLAVITALTATVVNAQSLDSVISKQANTSTFQDLIKSYPDIFSNLPNDVTVLAPNNYAFQKLGNWPEIRKNSTLVSAMLKYHILPKVVSMTSIEKGESAWSPSLLTDASFSTVNGGQHLILTKQPGGEVVFTSGFATRGTVVVEDLGFDKGLIQVIDSVMRLPENLELTARNAYTDITAFLGALFATDLMDEVVSKEKELTIFAPRDSAFQHLADSLAGLSGPDLKRILSYHIVPGGVSHIWELKNGSSLATAEKSSLAITRHTNFIFINSAQILQTDVLLSNGVVHIIDNILDPNQAAARPDVSKTAQEPVFKVVGTKTETGTGVPTPFTSHLPCTASCPVVATATPGISGPAADGSQPTQVTSSGAAAPARCTGFAGAGVGVGLAVGAYMVGL